MSTRGNFEAEFRKLDGNFAVAAGRVENFRAARQIERLHARNTEA